MVDDFKKVEKRKLVNVGFFSQEANASGSASPGENAALANEGKAVVLQNIYLQPPFVGVSTAQRRLYFLMHLSLPSTTS